MKKFETFNSTVVPMLIDHVDTDQIIPARFLKTTSKDGIGENLFRDWRFDAANQPIADFVLNQEIGKGRILFAGENFGCGSSREHAVWALQDYGFDAVIAPSFANIFKRNALNNGLLPIVLDQAFYNEIKEHLYVRSTRLEIDLMSQSVKHLESGRIGEFDIDSFRKECILKGYSDLDYLVSIKQEINDFEKSHVVPQIQF